MKRLFSVSLMIVFLISLFLCGCTNPSEDNVGDNNPEAAVSKASDYFPASVGSRWSYLGEGNEYTSFTRQAVYNTDNLVQFAENNTGTSVSQIFELKDDYIKLVYSEAESYEPGNLLKNGFTPNDERIVLKEPLEVGTTWENTDDTREIISINSNVDTPSGCFDNCLKVKITFEDSTMYDYYDKGTGLVKREFISDGHTISSTLQEFEIN